MAERKVFRFWEADCQRYVKKSEHDNWHFWDEMKLRLQQTFGSEFTVTPYQNRGDWLAVLWFRPKNTSRQSKDWTNQSQLMFRRHIGIQKVSFGFDLEQPSLQEITKYGQTHDKDAYRFTSLLESEPKFCQMIDNLLAKGLSIYVVEWDQEGAYVTSSEALLTAIKSLGRERSWDVIIADEIPCPEAVKMGEEINERVIEVFRLVWPIWLQVLPETIRTELQTSPINQTKEPTKAYTPAPSQIISTLSQEVRKHGFHFPRELLATYYLSLQTKPCVILTGISGTGKTKLAQLFAEWMSPSVEMQEEIPEEPEDDADAFYLEVHPSSLKSGFVIPKKDYGYFDLPNPGHTITVEIHLGNTKQTITSSLRNQIHTNGNTYVYFFSKKPVRKWLNANLEPGDILKVEVIEENTEYRFSKFIPTVRRVFKRTPRTAFISVRPDWTDNRGLVGFYNLITGQYQSTDFLHLLIQATIEDGRPHFVILDEMNLAKVEYYFADFLSVLESRYLQNGQLKQAPLRLHDLPRCILAQGQKSWDENAEVTEDDSYMCRVRCGACPLRAGLDEAQRARGDSDYVDACKAGFNPQRYVPPRLFVPRNVYFSGTVNVDETTYMFSPKVLDRANTIEFNAVDLKTYFEEAEAPHSTATTADDAIRAAFTFDGDFIRLPKAMALHQQPELTAYQEQLIDLNGRLHPHAMHFGYRVADEMLLYLWNAHALADADFDLDTAFDYQICQKILPKFHGSQAKLEAPLKALQAFCEEHEYEHSLAKITHMLEALHKEGFASFA